MTYSASLSAGRQQFATRQQNTARLNQDQKRLGPISNTIILIVLTCLVGLLYLTQVTKTNAYSYQLNDLQQQQQELKSQNDDLEVASARLQSLDRVKDSDAAKSLVSSAPSQIIKN